MRNFKKIFILLLGMVILFLQSPFAFAEIDIDVPNPFPTCAKALALEPGTSRTELNYRASDPEVDAFVEYFNTYIIGQEPAIDAFSEVFEQIRASLHDPSKPMGRFLFTGPTGVGKSELVKLLVKFLGGNPDFHLVSIEGGEYQESHMIARLIGAPAGYQGHDEPALLAMEELKKKLVTLTFKKPDGSDIQINVFLFDELEKANESLYKLMLGLLDNGSVTMSDNKKTIIRKSIVIATSNEGAREVNDLIEARKQRNEFRVREYQDVLSPEERDLTGRIDKKFREEIFQTYLAALKKHFAPEFLARFQKIIQFLHLGSEQFLQISNVMLANVQRRVIERANAKFVFRVTKEARKYFVDQGTDFRNGARELKGVIERTLTRQMARLINTGSIKEGDGVEIDVKVLPDGTKELVWYPMAAGLTKDEILEMADKLYPGFGLKKTQFDVADEEALVEEEDIVKDLLVKVNSGGYTDVLTRFWTETGDKVYRDDSLAGSAQGAGGAVKVQLFIKYFKIGNQWVQVMMAPNTDKPGARVQVNWKPEVPIVAKDLFPEGSVKQWTVEEVEHMMMLRETPMSGPEPVSSGPGKDSE